MTIIQAIILGIVQGLTEFLPISSSAHLVIVPYLLDWQIPLSEAFIFDVLVQLGTLAAVIIFFAKDLWEIIRDWFHGIFHRTPFETSNSRLGWYLIIASIPAGLLGITIKEQVEAVFTNPVLTAALLYGTAILLLIAEKIGKRKRGMETMRWADAVWIGVFQAISIFPGISRSGSTISGGMIRDFDRPGATRFSFLMSIPVMLAAGLLGTLDLIKIPSITSFLPVMVVGFLTAGVVGYLCIRWLLRYVSRRSFLPFIIYCAVFATLVIAFSFLNDSPARENSKESPSLVQVSFDPALTWMSPLLDLCAEGQPSISLVAQTAANPAGVIADFYFQINGNISPPEQAIIFGREKIRFIVNNANPNKSFDQEVLASILEGKILNWQDGTPVQIYVYRPQSEMMDSVSSYLKLQTGFSLSSLIAINPQDVLQKIRTDPSGIGFIPESFLDESVFPVTLGDSTAADPEFKIVVRFNHALTEGENSWLACIQKGIETE
jgi:undecaprenyl-diphosphatase